MTRAAEGSIAYRLERLELDWKTARACARKAEAQRDALRKEYDELLASFRVLSDERNRLATALAAVLPEAEPHLCSDMSWSGNADGHWECDVCGEDQGPQ